MQCIIMEKYSNQITHHDETKKRADNSQIVTAKENLKLSHSGPRYRKASGNTTITNHRQPRGTARKSRPTITRHQEDKLSKATSSLFPIKMIAIIEWK